MIWRKTPHKYGARKTICSAGHPHPSGLEASVCEILLLREKAGEIRGLKWQSTVALAYGVKWKVDWEFEQLNLICVGLNLKEIKNSDPGQWHRRFAEAKGKEDASFKLKFRMWKEGCGKWPLELWRGTHRKPYLDKIIYPKAEEVIER